MLRKISQKAIIQEEKPSRLAVSREENEYYLPHPQAKSIKYTPKEQQIINNNEKSKIDLKYSRKASYNGSLRAYSINQTKPDLPNQSKEQSSTNRKQLNARLNIQNRAIRSSSHSDGLQLRNSKSSLKLQLSNRKNTAVKRINLKVESPFIKKQKNEQKQANFDSYYNNDGTTAFLDSRTVRTQNKLENSSINQTQMLRNEKLTNLYNRCYRVIEDYQQQLQQAKKDNSRLAEQNRRLKRQKFFNRV